MPGWRIMPGSMDSMCFCIRSIWLTTVSHMSTFVCHRAFSAGPREDILTELRHRPLQ